LKYALIGHGNILPCGIIYCFRYVYNIGLQVDAGFNNNEYFAAISDATSFSITTLSISSPSIMSLNGKTIISIMSLFVTLSIMASDITTLSINNT